MSVVAVFTVPASDFLFADVFASDADPRFELERVVPIEGCPAPYVRVATRDVRGVTERLRAEPAVADVVVLDEGADETLLHVEWHEAVRDRLAPVVETEGTLLEAVGRDGAWRLSLRFPDHEALTAYHGRCVEDGVTLHVEVVRDPAALRRDDAGEMLTDVQRETLLTALEMGYFAVPREATLADLAEVTGVSDTAVSQRLRRGVERLADASVP